jgi:dipeptidyl aminopeptidase/acylaminoacyl peptidase
MYGGSPYGEGLSNWLKYSISFNLDRIHTPLLLETMGNGAHDDDPHSPALSLQQTSEVFVGLKHLRRPVELYYYPNEMHTPEHPLARLANLTRNVDWFRFWLQGYERPAPEDPTQYVRWKLLDNPKEQ